MENINLLKRILLNKDDWYWCFAMKHEYREHCQTKRGDDYIVVSCLPEGTPKGLKKNEILLTHLEALQTATVPVLYLCKSYPPFQIGQTMYNIWDGFPIKINSIHEFIRKGIELESTDIFDYNSLYKKISEQ